MRIRFALRDVFWMIFLLAVMLGWWLDHRRLDNEVNRYELLMFRAGVTDPGLASTIPTPVVRPSSSGIVK